MIVPSNEGGSVSRRRLILVLASTMFVLLVTGIWFYHLDNGFLVEEAHKDLEAVARLKVEQITAWRKARLADAAVITESPFLSRAIRAWLRQPEKRLSEEILVRLRSVQRHYDYRDILIVDATGLQRLSLTEDNQAMHGDIADAFRMAAQTRMPAMTDLHLAPGRQYPHVDIVAPIFSEGDSGAPVGAIVLQANASHFLYPLLQTWPVPTRTAETLLVRRQGDDVLYLNELRHRKRTALALRRPLDSTELPAALAVLGKTGVVRGRDYRGVDVLAALRGVPDSPWFMVAKIDASEALSAARRESVLILAVILGLILAAVAMAGVIWQRSSNARYRALLHAESVQRKIEERFRVTLFSVGDGVIATNATGEVELLNPVAERLTGWLQSEARGRPIEDVFDIVNEKTGQGAENPVSLVLQRGRAVDLENDTVLRSRDGRQVPIEDSAAPIKDPHGRTTGAVMVFHDVTEKRKSNAALLAAYGELEQRVQERTAELTRQAELINLTHDAIIVRGLDDRITFWSKGAEETYGWTSEEAVGAVIHFLLDTQFPDGMDTMKAGLRADGRWDGEIIHTRKDGRRITVMSRRVLRRSVDGTPYGVMEINHDITERKQIEAQLRQAQKLEAIGTLTGGIAHDFNNILGAIIGFSEIAGNRLSEGTRERLCVDRILEAGIRGRNLVKRMLTFSRGVEHEKRPLRLSSSIEETVNLLRASIPSSIDVRMTVESESGHILADVVQLQQVVMNLCTNAAHAMRNTGGPLSIELSDHVIGPVDRSDGIKPGSYVKLVVRDAGEGIPADIIERIFDPFFTTKKPGEGTGLGLSVVHGIVKSHDGHISVESEPGKGTTFTVLFPTVKDREPVASQAEEPIPTGNERILFVEDEEMLAEVGAEILRNIGYEVAATTKPDEALMLLKQDPLRFDLLLTDQTMPVMTGLELAREVRSVCPDTPVILCTGFSHSVDPASVAAAGIAALVLKPLTKREMAETIRRVLDERRPSAPR